MARFYHGKHVLITRAKTTGNEPLRERGRYPASPVPTGHQIIDLAEEKGQPLLIALAFGAIHPPRMSASTTLARQGRLARATPRGATGQPGRDRGARGSGLSRECPFVMVTEKATLLACASGIEPGKPGVKASLRRVGPPSASAPGG